MRTRHLGRRWAWLGALLAVSTSSCASDRYKPPLRTWDDAETEAPEGAAAETGDAPKKEMTAAEFAASFRTAQECAEEARARKSSSMRHAATLVKACMEREDFADLDFLLSPDFRSALDLPLQGAAFARIIAYRGGWVAEDVTRLQQGGVGLMLLSQAVEKGDRAAGSAVIARLRYLQESSLRPGKLLLEEATLTPDDTMLEMAAAGGQQSSRFPSFLTGHQVLFEFLEPGVTLTAGDEFVVLADFLGMDRVLDAEADEVRDYAIIRVRERFVPTSTQRP
ncbi:MAG: hypothetical protein ACO3JL_15370 [Myxococcota bacterium]